MNNGQKAQGCGFQGLTPDAVLNLVEQELNVHCTNLCRPLNSYINRVYELEDEDGTGIIIKFYRPGRWSREALQEEHDFLLELAAEELPVIAPLELGSGNTLGLFHETLFAVFPKKGGRYTDELNDDQWGELGRLLGRVHLLGASGETTHRPIIRPDLSTADHLTKIVESGVIPQDQSRQYIDLVNEIIEETTPLFKGIDSIRIHGDCHSGNLIYRPDESYYLIDFDDMAVGPPVQDFWMLLPGTMDSSFVEIDLFLEGYETFRRFDQSSLRLIEPLRAMRFVHYTAWCAYQVVEDGSSPVVPNFGTREYWQQEMNDLADQLERIRDNDVSPGNML